MPCLVYHMIPLSRIPLLENQNLLSKDIQSPQFYVNPVPLSFRGFPPLYASLYCFSPYFSRHLFFNSTKITKDPFHAQWTHSIAFSIPLPLTGGALLRYFRSPSSKNLFFI